MNLVVLSVSLLLFFPNGVSHLHLGHLGNGDLCIFMLM